MFLKCYRQSHRPGGLVPVPQPRRPSPHVINNFFVVFITPLGAPALLLCVGICQQYTSVTQRAYVMEMTS